MYINTLPGHTSRAPFGREADEGGGGGQGEPGNTDSGQTGGQAVSDGGSGDSWTPPATQAELDKIIEKAIGRTRRQYGDYDALKAKAEQFDTLAAASQTDQERAVAEAQQTAYSAAMGAIVPELVRAKFEAKAVGRLTEEQLDVLLEDADLTKYVDDQGKPDVDKIERKIKALAPKVAPPSFGQGNRGSAPSTSSMDDVIRKQAGFSRT